MGRIIQVHTCKSIKFHSRTSCEVLPTTECCPYLVSMGLFFFGEFKYEAGVLAQQRSNQPLGVTQIDTAVVGHSKKMREPGFWTVWLQSYLYNNQAFTVWLKPKHHWAACYHHTNFLYQEIFENFARLATQTKATPYQTRWQCLGQK